MQSGEGTVQVAALIGVRVSTDGTVTASENAYQLERKTIYLVIIRCRVRAKIFRQTASVELCLPQAFWYVSRP
jgi:hypothetical protein